MYTGTVIPSTLADCKFIPFDEVTVLCSRSFILKKWKISQNLQLHHTNLLVLDRAYCPHKCKTVQISNWIARKTHLETTCGGNKGKKKPPPTNKSRQQNVEIKRVFLDFKTSLNALLNSIKIGIFKPLWTCYLGLPIGLSRVSSLPLFPWHSPLLPVTTACGPCKRQLKNQPLNRIFHNLFFPRENSHKLATLSQIHFLFECKQMTTRRPTVKN